MCISFRKIRYNIFVMKETIQKSMIDILLHASAPVSGKDLAARLSISEKTVLKYLNFIRHDIQPYGAQIITRQGLGSLLEITNPNLFDCYMKQLSRADYLNDPKLRTVYIMTRLLTESNYLNVYDLAEELSISPSLLRGCLRSIEKTFQSYQIQLQHSHFYGYKAKGSEACIRQCLLKECRSSIELDEFLQNSQSQIDFPVIEGFVSDTLKDYNIAISTNGIRSLSLHILISVNRCETENIIEPIDDRQFHIRSSTEFFIINSINRRIKAEYGIDLPVDELTYLAVHLSGKQRIDLHRRLQVRVSSEALVFYNKFLRRIHRYASIDFFEDDELRASLLNHIVPFLARFQNDIQIQQSELSSIRTQFPFAYDLAQTALFDLCGASVTTSEISYFALHLALALEKNKTSPHKVNIAVIANQISAIYQMISFRLNQRFKEDINTIAFFTLENLSERQLGKYPIILNTTGKVIPFPCSALNVTPFLNFEDMDAISGMIARIQADMELSGIASENLFFNIEASSKQEAIRKMISHISQYADLPEDFCLQIMTRENFESTSYASGFAIPHPLNNTGHLNLIAVARAASAIPWDHHKVHLIFLTCFYNNNSIAAPFFKKIGLLADRPDAVQNLMEAENFEKFFYILSNLQ